MADGESGGRRLLDGGFGKWWQLPGIDGMGVTVLGLKIFSRSLLVFEIVAILIGVASLDISSLPSFEFGFLVVESLG
ncbi:hypothetical protein Nepgr_026655 [Nepenthes gracilis]|uniref:Uncharacterized protein n=1 Tax=Nepenthes gracilis TaxID=150966 RepID=A0AAD3TA54_NEPGR|nr:hypothetical protein Nepgr_026655 [Nepenthes gracilis]